MGNNSSNIGSNNNSNNGNNSSNDEGVICGSDEDAKPPPPRYSSDSCDHSHSYPALAGNTPSVDIATPNNNSSDFVAPLISHGLLAATNFNPVSSRIQIPGSSPPDSLSSSSTTPNFSPSTSLVHGALPISAATSMSTPGLTTAGDYIGLQSNVIMDSNHYFTNRKDGLARSQQQRSHHLPVSTNDIALDEITLSSTVSSYSSLSEDLSCLSLSNNNKTLPGHINEEVFTPATTYTKNSFNDIDKLYNPKYNRKVINPYDIDIDSIIEKLLEVPTSSVGGNLSKKNELIITKQEINYIIYKAKDVFMKQPTLLELCSPIKIVGDLHGQYGDLLRVLKLSGFPPMSNYLFLGDYVDRGKQSLETILLLLCFKIKYPNNFFMLRGNHESGSISKIYGFYDECKRRLSLVKIWKSFVDVFNVMPIAAIISDKIFCVHGGLSPKITSIKQINKIKRPTDIPDYGMLTDLLWSDPNKKVSDFTFNNERGVSYFFGKKNVDQFLKTFNFDLIVRGHMVVEDGYEFFNKKRLVTVFSAPNYCGEFDNWGAILSIDENLICSFELLKPRPLSTTSNSTSSSKSKSSHKSKHSKRKK